MVARARAYAGLPTDPVPDGIPENQGVHISYLDAFVRPEMRTNSFKLISVATGLDFQSHQADLVAFERKYLEYVTAKRDYAAAVTAHAADEDNRAGTVARTARELAEAGGGAGLFDCVKAAECTADGGSARAFMWRIRADMPGLKPEKISAWANAVKATLARRVMPVL